MSSVFYFAWGAPVFVFIILVSILTDHLLNITMLRSEGSRRKYLLSAIILLNVGLLVYFKYSNFLFDNLGFIFKLLKFNDLQVTKAIVPLGVSFITFQKISYSIDVYRKKVKPAEGLVQYAYFILLFPKLFAGPIVRFGEISQSLADSGGEITNDQRLAGFFRFVIGLAKKVLIANVLGEQVDQLFALPAQDFSTVLAWTAALGYTFQIYFDFSGYSDMAIGIGTMMGFRFPENFNNPYTAGSITEFWRRWHMSLSNWLRDYIFLPRAYASSRRLKENYYLGLKAEQWIYMEATLVTMLICGVWHGAAWTFIIWGLFQGVIMILERLFLLKVYKKRRYIAIPITFFLTILGWMMFRAENIHQGLTLIRNLFSIKEAVNYTYVNPKFYTILIIAAFSSFYGVFKGIESWQNKVLAYDQKTSSFVLITIISILLFILSLATITSTGFSPFIYFRF